MSDSRPEGIQKDSIDSGAFPLDAWEATLPTDTTPTVTLKPEWTLDANIACPYPIGAVYWQLPGKSAPATLWPTVTWTNISDAFPGEFFRAEGGAASAFASGEQADQMQGHRHYDQAVGSGSGLPGGALYQNVQSTTSNPITDGTNGTPRTGAETRPINVTIRLWERTA